MESLQFSLPFLGRHFGLIIPLTGNSAGYENARLLQHLILKIFSYENNRPSVNIQFSFLK